MTTFLLIISLLLNGVSIYFIMILYSRQNRLLEAEKSQNQFKKEIETEISAFLFEMKEENEEFLKRFQHARISPLPTAAAPIGMHTQNPEPFVELPRDDMFGNIKEADTRNWEAKAGQALKKQAVKVYQKTIAATEDTPAANLDAEKQPENEDEQTKNEELYRELLINQVTILQNQGLTINEIAQRLNKGKTEIELLMKFS